MRYGVFHIHRGIAVGARHAVPLREQIEQFGKPVAGSIPTIIRSFKSATTRQINEHRGAPRIPVWQRNYYEHIVRNESEWDRIREYIEPGICIRTWPSTKNLRR